jgi:hypothetical protein
MTNEKLHQLARIAHNNAKAKGFWETARPEKESLILVVSELAEALEAARANKFCKKENFNEALAIYREIGRDDIIPEEIKGAYSIYFNDFCRGTFEEEIADTFIRILDFAESRKQTFEVEELLEADLPPIGFYIPLILFDITAHIMKDELNEAIYLLQLLSIEKGFDLILWARMKMKYNETRGYKHGKSF